MAHRPQLGPDARLLERGGRRTHGIPSYGSRVDRPEPRLQPPPRPGVLHDKLTKRYRADAPPERV